LGFFNFTLRSEGIKKRKTIIEEITDIFAADSKVKSKYEIYKLLLAKRFVAKAGLNEILHNCDFLTNYGGNYWGLSKRDIQNRNELVKNAHYFEKLITNELFPETTIKKLCPPKYLIIDAMKKKLISY